MNRKRNGLFSSLESLVSRRRIAQPKTLSKEWWRGASLRDREKALKKSYGFKARDARFLADSSYNSVFGDRVQNPREFPGWLPKVSQDALRKLMERNNSMAQKKKSKKKKRNPRKGVMPKALREYWAKKRAKKAKKKARRRNPPKAKRRKRPTKARTRNPGKPRRTRSRRKAVPRRATPSTLNLGSGFTSGQIKKVARLVARVSGKRTTINA